MVEKMSPYKTSKTPYLLYFFILKALSPFLILIAPSFISWFFDFGRRHRRLPSRQERIEKKESILDEFVFFNYDSPQFEEVNIVLRGDANDVKNIGLPTFFINPHDSIPIVDYDRYYVTSDRLIFKAMMGFPDSDFYKRFDRGFSDTNVYVMPYGLWLKEFILEGSLKKKQLLKLKDLVESRKDILGFNHNYISIVCGHRYQGENIQIGSGILCIISMLKLSRKVNVYGWDSFLEDKMPKSFFGQTMKLWSNFDDFHPGSRFSASVLNWIYAYRLINEFDRSRLVVHGKVRQVAQFRWVEKYLFKVIYK